MRELLLVACMIASPAVAQSIHEVRGYTKADGTYVAPHVQTNPDATKTNNLSTQGNVNPAKIECGKLGDAVCGHHPLTLSEARSSSTH